MGLAGGLATNGGAAAGAVSSLAGPATITTATAAVPLTINGSSAGASNDLLDIFQNSGAANPVFSVSTVANAVNGFQAGTSTGTGVISLTAIGAGATVSVQIVAKGSGQHISLNSGVIEAFRATGVASGVNFIQAIATIATVGPSIGVSAASGDTNADLGLAIKGTGVVNYLYAVTALGGGAAPTLGTIGATGPATAAQNSWLAIKINGTASWIPIWR